ncbi:hypothetical protein GALMADRAFT_148205 [Galerina marginata CBS 339.88]|uniref:Aminoglycoside phosphotransferase domain-containing protein n=1 Tax=Galerina marginata (strain CBS 339.88) TaxID=685588 RepID=A0A067SE90_GALM3|nr:hypothetical protein GALMADRAFT_148205 [Galerina marginata CBS 339.88]
MDCVPNVKTPIQKAFISRIPPDILKNTRNLIATAKAKRLPESEDHDLKAVKLEEGGYNEVFLISPKTGSSHFNVVEPFVVRLPKGNTLLPYQVMNEVNCISMISSRCPDIPVPALYDFSSDVLGAFIAQEYVDGNPLSSSWNGYTEDEKQQVAQQIADIIVNMGEIHFDQIGSFTGDAGVLLGPTVEGSKLFKGRAKFHSRECYDIGPYKNTKDYVLACYDKEIYYYTHAPTSDIDCDLFEDKSLQDFVHQLLAKRGQLATSSVATDEPFVLVHGDFNGQNIIMQGSKVRAVLDWEFSGAYPLSELVGGVGFDVLEVIDDESEEENLKWNRMIMAMVGETARQRGWSEKLVEMLVSDGDPVVGHARMEMFPT